jgi:N-acetylglucosaminyl-diphospho-decaprenol L-rhamnosyltransferase
MNQEADKNPLIVVVVNWNSFDLCISTVKTLVENNPSLKMVIKVFDNASQLKNGLENLVDYIGIDNLILSDRNIGFGPANNHVIELYPNHHILVLNPDTLQTSDVVTRTLSYLKENGDVGVVGIKHIEHRTGKTQAAAFKFESPWSQIFNYFGLGKILFNYAYVDQEKDQDVDWVVGSFMLVRSEVIRQTGGFDSEIFLNNEDIEWCSRIRSLGWRIRYFGDYSMRHVGGGTRHFMADSTLTFAKSHLDYLLKIKAFVPAFLYYVITCFFFGCAILRDFFFLGIGKVRRQHVSMKINRFRKFLFLNSVQSGI